MWQAALRGSLSRAGLRHGLIRLPDRLRRLPGRRRRWRRCWRRRRGWRGLHQAQRGIAARRVVQQAQHALRRLGDVLGGTLAPRDFVRAAAAAVDALAERAGGEPDHAHAAEKAVPFVS